MTNKVRNLFKEGTAKKTVQKVKSFSKRDLCVCVAIILCAVISMTIITIINKNFLNDLVDSVLPQSLVTFTDENNFVYVTEDVTLLQEVEYQGKIYEVQWKSNKDGIVNNTGKVIRPQNKNIEVVLTAVISHGITRIEIPHKLTVVCTNIVNAEEMKSLIAIPTKANEVLTHIAFEENKLALNSDIDAALFAEYYINQINNTSIKLSFVQAIPSLTGKVFMFKQAVKGIPVQDTFVNVFVNQNGSPIEISVHLEEKEIISSTELIKTQDVVNTVIKLKNIDAKNIYEITEQYIDSTKMYKVSYIVNGSMYATFLSVAEITQNNVETTDNDGINNKESIFKQTIEKYQKVEPNAYCGINIFTQNEEDMENYTQITTNIHNIYVWFDKNIEVQSFNFKNTDMHILLSNESTIDITRYSKPLQLFYFNHPDGYEQHMGTGKDIVAHEYTHALFHNIVGNIDRPGIEPLSIEEAYADVFACLVDGNWMIGESIIGDNVVLRTIAPSQDVLTTIGTTAQTYKDENWSDNDSYVNSVVLSKVAFTMKQNGISDKDIARIWYHSMFYGYHNESTYYDVKENVLHAANALNYKEQTINVIHQAFQDLGI